MTNDKGPSISLTDFHEIVPNGTWIRQRVQGSSVTGLPLPIEGIMFLNVDETEFQTIKGGKHLHVTPLDAVDPVVLYAGEVEYKVGEEWIDFRELCIRVQQRRLDEAGAADVDAHPLTWMTHKTELNMSIAQIGAMLYEVAVWIEAQGNRGYSDNDLLKALPGLRIKVLGNGYRLAWENILFFGEGGRKRDFSGWGVHKYKPAHWKRTWLDRFGPLHPLADVITDEIWDEALAEHKKRSVKRRHETYADIDLEKAETQQIAHMAAAMWLMSRWAQQRSWTHWETREIWRVQSRLYIEAHHVFRHELEYRQDQQPKKRRSKKATQAARDDWATASSYFYPGIGFDAYRFYTQAYVVACCESDVAPDVHVDHTKLPRDIQRETAISQNDEAGV